MVAHAFDSSTRAAGASLVYIATSTQRNCLGGKKKSQRANKQNRVEILLPLFLCFTVAGLRKVVVDVAEFLR